MDNILNYIYNNKKDRPYGWSFSVFHAIACRRFVES